MTRQDLIRLKELEKKATKGPWGTEFHDGDWGQAIDSKSGPVAYTEQRLPDVTGFMQNAELISESRNLLPALIQALEKSQEALKDIKRYYDLREGSKRHRKGYVATCRELAASALLPEDKP